MEQGTPTTNEAQDLGVTSAGQPVKLTFGQKLVGLNFNPSNDDAVGNVKQLFADITDILHNQISVSETSEMQSMLFNHAIGEILNAQMNVVKVLTLKY